MKRDKKGFEKGFLAAALSLSLMIGCQSAVATEKTAQASEQQKKEIQAKLKVALENAKKNGEQSVNIFLGEKPDIIQPGDLVEIDYTISLENGTIVRTNIKEKAELRKQDIRSSKFERYADSEIYSPDPILVGEASKKKPLFRDIIGKKNGYKGRIVLSPGAGSFEYDTKKVKNFARVRRLPLTESISVNQFLSMYGEKPENGAEVQINPYLKSKVTRIENEQVTLTVNATDGETIKDEMGDTLIRVQGQNVLLVLTPRVGADFVAGKRNGLITAVNEASFTVDFNPPEAGRKLVMDFHITSFTKASEVHSAKIDWQEDYDKGLETQVKSKKPMLLFLYADWCPWCKKLQESVFSDPRIMSLEKDLLWVKVNSDKEPLYKEMFKQEGYPTLIMMNTDQTTYRKVEGFRGARKLRKEIRQWMDDLASGKTIYTGKPDKDKNSGKSNSCSA